MARSYFIVTLLALLGVVAGGLHLRKAWQDFTASHNVASIQPEQEPPAKAATAAGAPSPVSQDWTAIAAQDPFSFDRTDVPIVPVVAQANKPKVPKPFLFGIMAIGGDRTALLRPSAGTARASRPLKIGEEMDGWKLVEIGDKSVVVESDGGRETLVIDDPTVAIPRDYSKTMVTATAAPPPPPVNAAPAEPVQSPSAASAPQSGSQTSAGPPRTRTIDTPFGKKVIPIPEP